MSVWSAIGDGIDAVWSGLTGRTSRSALNATNSALQANIEQQKALIASYQSTLQGVVDSLTTMKSNQTINMKKMLFIGLGGVAVVGLGYLLFSKMGKRSY